MSESIGVALIRQDTDLQMRAEGTDPGVVSEYAEAMMEGATFPPIVVFFDGMDYWPADGFHRLAAAKSLGETEIAADVRRGTRRDAELFAAGANNNHGLRRRRADIRNAIERLLKDPEWSRWSDREISKACGCDHKTVGKVRAELSGEIPQMRTFVRNGTVSTMKVSVAASSGTMVAKLFAKITDDALIAECRRRGVEVILHA